MQRKRQTADAGSEIPGFVSRQVTFARRYFLDLAPQPGTGLTVVCGGVESVAADYLVARRTFPFWCVEFVAEGKGTLQLGKRTISLEAGSIFTYGPGVAHTIRANASTPMLKYYVDFAGKNGEKLLREQGIALGEHRRLVTPLAVRELFDLLQKFGLEQTEFSQSLCRSILPTLLIRIAQESLPVGPLPMRAWETYLRLKSTMREEYLRFRTVEEVARHCLVSVEHASRLFQRFDHLRPYQFLMRQRMNYAAELLSREGALVKQVARELGFADQYQFSRAFKRVYGISPAHFQEQQWQAESPSGPKRPLRPTSRQTLEE